MAFLLNNNNNSPFNNNINNYFNNNNISNYINSNLIFNNNCVKNKSNFSLHNQNEKILFNKYPNSKKCKKEQKKFYRKYESKRPFDWICNRCSNLNYSFRKSCNICNLPLEDNPYYKSDF